MIKVITLMPVKIGASFNSRVVKDVIESGKVTVSINGNKQRES